MTESQRIGFLRDKRVLVMGLGRFGGGVGLVRFLARHQVRVTVTDAAPPAELKESCEAVAGLPGVELSLGGHRDVDFRASEIVFVNPAVSPDNRFLALARSNGARLWTEIGLFLDLCPARVIGVTGTSGKSTTSALAAAMLEAGGARALLGGNVGGSLLGELASLAPSDTVVLELSSFQLTYLRECAGGWRAPEIAAVLNVYDDHLNWHGSYAHYASGKRTIFAPPRGAPDAWAVAPGDDGLILPWARSSGRSVLAVGSRAAGCDAWVGGRDAVAIECEGKRSHLFRRRDLLLPGSINQRNAAYAAGIAFIGGAPPEAIERAARTFRGLPHRLELVAEAGGVRYINSSVATTPLEAARSLEAAGKPAVLLAGGGEGKGQPFHALARAAERSCRCAILFGQAAPRMAAEFAREAPGLPCRTVQRVEEAVALAASAANPGDTVILAPGCPSYDAFPNFTARGELFRRCVRDAVGAPSRHEP